MRKSSKPRFRRQESWRLDRVPESWRRPRGVTSRVRKEKGGWPPRVKVGRASNALYRGLHPRGLEEKHVERLSDLSGLDSKSHIVRLSRKLGERKRLMLLDKARELNLRVANPGKTGAAEAEVTEAQDTFAQEPAVPEQEAIEPGPEAPATAEEAET